MSRAARSQSGSSRRHSGQGSPWVVRIATLLLVVASALFSFLNAGERVSVNFGVFRLYQISLVGLVFTIFILGMLTMFLFGLRQDRAIRDALKNTPMPPWPSERPREPLPSDPPLEDPM